MAKLIYRASCRHHRSIVSVTVIDQRRRVRRYEVRKRSAVNARRTIVLRCGVEISVAINYSTEDRSHLSSAECEERDAPFERLLALRRIGEVGRSSVVEIRSGIVCTTSATMRNNAACINAVVRRSQRRVANRGVAR